MPGYISKSGLVYSPEEVAKIISDENWTRDDFRMSNSTPAHVQYVEEHEIPKIIEIYEQEKRYDDS